MSHTPISVSFAPFQSPSFLLQSFLIPTYLVPLQVSSAPLQPFFSFPCIFPVPLQPLLFLSKSLLLLSSLSFPFHVSFLFLSNLSCSSLSLFCSSPTSLCIFCSSPTSLCIFCSSPTSLCIFYSSLHCKDKMPKI